MNGIPIRPLFHWTTIPVSIECSARVVRRGRSVRSQKCPNNFQAGDLACLPLVQSSRLLTLPHLSARKASSSLCPLPLPQILRNRHPIYVQEHDFKGLLINSLLTNDTVAPVSTKHFCSLSPNCALIKTAVSRIRFISKIQWANPRRRNRLALCRLPYLNG